MQPDSNTEARVLAPENVRRAILSQLPQKPPFLFIDEITELSTEHIVARRKFRLDEDFYRGHFPGDPVTPGVILLEAMAQAGLVALGLYLASQSPKQATLRTLFTESNVEFHAIVPPEHTVIMRGEKIMWRMGKLRSRVSMHLEDGTLAAGGIVAGQGVKIA